MGELFPNRILKDDQEFVSKEKRKDDTQGGGSYVYKPQREKGARRVCHKTMISALEKPGRRCGRTTDPGDAEPLTRRHRPVRGLGQGRRTVSLTFSPVILMGGKMRIWGRDFFSSLVDTYPKLLQQYHLFY